MSYHMQPFTKAEWSSFAGAMPFATGEQPEFVDGRDWIFVMDSQALEFYRGEERWQLPHGLPYKAAEKLADYIVNGLGNWPREELARWGFTAEL